MRRRRQPRLCVQEKDDLSRQLDAALTENASLTNRLRAVKVEATERSLDEIPQTRPPEGGVMGGRADSGSEGSAYDEPRVSYILQMVCSGVTPF